MAYHNQLVLSATPQRLSDLYGGQPGAQPDAAKDVPYTQLYLHATGADAFIGTSNVSTTVWGLTLKATEGGPFSLSGGGRNIKLSEFWAVGPGSTLHIMGIPF